MKTVAVLFVRGDSQYKTMDGVDAWDAGRDALGFDGGMPVIAHPPCRAWGILSHMAKPTPGEKGYAPWALAMVRKCGGVLEHPVSSRLWRECGVPLPDEFPDAWGGYTVDVDQYAFGHVANKPTRLYVVGCERSDLPAIPVKKGRAPKSITGQVPGTARCTQYEREYTPAMLREWLVEVARRTDA